MRKMWDLTWLKNIFAQKASDGKIDGIANGNIPIVKTADLGLTLQATVAKYGLSFLVIKSSVNSLLILKDTGSAYNVFVAMPQTSSNSRASLLAGTASYDVLNNVDFNGVGGMIQYLNSIPAYSTITSGVGWTGSVNYCIENDVLHIKGTITIGGSQIASGSTLFTLPITFRPSIQAGHGSAINPAAGSPLSGIIVKPSGEVVTLQALSASTTYNIAAVLPM